MNTTSDSDQKLTIALTGATGFLGFRTLEKLVEQASVVKIKAGGRTLKKSHQVDHPKVEYVLGDLSDVTYVDQLIEGVDILIHAAALSSPWGKDEMFIQANLKSQENLIKAAKKQNISRFIFISTPSLYFNHEDRLDIKESDPLPEKLVNAYARTKRQAEVLLEKSGLTYIILRPRALTGRGDTVIMPRLVRAHDEGRLKVIGSGKNLADLTSVSNASDAILLAIKAEGVALNEAFNISNGEPVLLWEAIEDVLSKMGRKLNTKKVSYSLVKQIAGLMEFKSKISNYKEPALTKYGVGVLAKSQTLDISKARKLLKYEPKLSTQEAIQEFVDWYLENEEN